MQDASVSRIGAPFVHPKESSIIWSKLRAAVISIQAQWLTARAAGKEAVLSQLSLQGSEATRSFLEPRGRAGGGRDSVSAGASRRPRPESVFLHQVLRIRLPLSIADVRRGDDRVEADPGGVGVAMDLVRVHGLQRDLVSFSRAAGSVCEAVLIGLYSGDKEVDPHRKSTWPMDAAAIKLVQSLEDLRSASDRLLLDTACFAPIAPMSTSDQAMRSHLTGIEALETEVKPARRTAISRLTVIHG